MSVAAGRLLFIFSQTIAVSHKSLCFAGSIGALRNPTNILKQVAFAFVGAG